MTGSEHLALTHARIFTGDEVLEDRAVVIRDGVIAALPADLDESRFPGQVVDMSGLSLAPGLIDLQVNGGGDHLFNQSPDVDALEAIVAAHRQQGTTDLLITYITGPLAGMERAGRAVRTATRAGVGGLLGVHFEGPLLNPERAGVHDPELLRAHPIDPLADALSVTAGTCPTVVTLAPETVPSGFIASLSGRGIVVSAGHTEATPVQIRRAVREGLRAGTHVWNAMPPMAGRRPGPVAALLTDPAIWCGFIADGHHLDPATLSFSLAVKAPRRSMLVSDAMPPVGGRQDTFLLEGRKVSRRGDRCETADGTLAGAAVPLIEGVRRCVQTAGVPLDEALRMASLYPAECLGIADRRGRVAVGYPAHLVALDDGIRPVAVYAPTGPRVRLWGPQTS